MGQVMSDTCGVAFGGTIEACALKLGLPLPGLTDAQQRLGAVKRVSTLGGGLGIPGWVNPCGIFWYFFGGKFMANRDMAWLILFEGHLIHVLGC